MPGIPLFVLTHHVPDAVPAGDPPYTFVTDGIHRAVEQAWIAAAGKDVALMGASIVRQGLQTGTSEALFLSAGATSEVLDGAVLEVGDGGRLDRARTCSTWRSPTFSSSARRPERDRDKVQLELVDQPAAR